MTRTVDPNTLSSLRPQVAEALDGLSERIGLKLSVGKVNYDPLRVRECIEAETEDGRSAAQVEFESAAALFGLDPEDFGVEFGYAGKRHTVVGLLLKEKAGALLVRDQDGKTHTLDPEVYKSFRDLERLQENAA